jgi:hypothetical protein
MRQLNNRPDTNRKPARRIRRRFRRRIARRSQLPARDSSGYVIFSAGDAGAAHVRAHELLDRGQIERGHRELGAYLEHRTGAGSDWVHLHFHMGIFELALGDWTGAYRRFRKEILPAASNTDCAYTDAPALLWRLALAAPQSVPLPWEALRRSALKGMREPSHAFVELHHLLALAGAGDSTSIERWLASHADGSAQGGLLRSAALALRNCALGAYAESATLLRATAPQLPIIGGSRAQRELFGELERWCKARANNAASASRRIAA